MWRLTIQRTANGSAARRAQAGVEQLGVNRRASGTLEKLIKAPAGAPRGAAGANANANVFFFSGDD